MSYKIKARLIFLWYLVVNIYQSWDEQRSKLQVKWKRYSILGIYHKVEKHTSCNLRFKQRFILSSNLLHMQRQPYFKSSPRYVVHKSNVSPCSVPTRALKRWWAVETSATPATAGAIRTNASSPTNLPYHIENNELRNPLSHIKNNELRNPLSKTLVKRLFIVHDLKFLRNEYLGALCTMKQCWE
jgi:hypothetical protein